MDSPPPTHESPAAGSSAPPNSQGEHGDWAEIDFAGKTKEVDHLLKKLKDAGMEIDEKMARIIGEEIAGIKAEAVRARWGTAIEAMDEARRKKNIRWRRWIVPATTTVFGLSLFTIAYASGFAGFCCGVKFHREYMKQDLGAYLIIATVMKHFVEGQGSRLLK